MLPDQNWVLLCFLIPNALPSRSLHDSRVLFGKLWPLRLHIHPKSSKLFTREHRSAVRKEKHTALPNCRCLVTSKIEHVIGPGAVTFPVFLKAWLHDLPKFGEVIVFFFQRLKEQFSVMGCGNTIAKVCLTLAPCPAGTKTLCECLRKYVGVCMYVFFCIRMCTCLWIIIKGDFCCILVFFSSLCMCACICVCARSGYIMYPTCVWIAPRENKIG